jgi:hypothetical protein
MLRVEGRQPYQRIVERNQIQVRLAANAICCADGYPVRLGSALGRFALPRVVDKDVSHELRSDPKELRAAGEARGPLTHKPQIDFIDQRSGLKCVIGSFTLQVFLCQTAQFVLDQGHQFMERCLIALSPSSELLGYVFIWLHAPSQRGEHQFLRRSPR